MVEDWDELLVFGVIPLFSLFTGGVGEVSEEERGEGFPLKLLLGLEQ